MLMFKSSPPIYKIQKKVKSPIIIIIISEISNNNNNNNKLQSPNT